MTVIVVGIVAYLLGYVTSALLAPRDLQPFTVADAERVYKAGVEDGRAQAYVEWDGIERMWGRP